MYMFKLYTHKKIRIINKTKAQIGIITKLIDFCIPKKIKNYPLDMLIIYRNNYRKTLKKTKVEKKFNLKSAYPFRAIVYHGMKNNKYRPLVIITVPKRNMLIEIIGDKKLGYLPMKLVGQIEDFIASTSHELYHCVQGVLNEPYDETAADKYAISRLKRWRKNAPHRS